MSGAEQIIPKDEVKAEPTVEDEPSETAGEDHDEKSDNPEESCRIQIKNLPHHMNYPMVKKFLQKQLPNTQLRKMKTVKGTTYVSFSSHDEAKNAVEKLESASIKNRKLQVRFTAEEPQTPANAAPLEPPKSAKELVTPLADKPYEEQLKQKHDDSSWTASTLFANMRRCGIDWANKTYGVVANKVLPSPVITGYRNKSEFTVGRNVKGEPCVGFVSGKMAERRCIIVPVDECVNFSENTRRIVRAFEEVVKNSDVEPFDEFERVGFWKRITVRDFLGDCMLIVTVHPHPDPDVVCKQKLAVIERFVQGADETQEDELRVTSIFWQVHENASDPEVFTKLAGAPYVYETVLGVRFRISPATFFQTNTRGCEVLYTAIYDALELPKPKSELAEKEAEYDDPLGLLALPDPRMFGESLEKRRRQTSPPDANAQAGKSPSTEPILVLDICCGAGAIGICLMKCIQRAAKTKAFKGKYGCVGIELVPEAVKDAELNASANGFGKDRCRYVAGKAEDVFRDLQYHLPPGFDLNQPTNVIGILDPPRAGLGDKVIIGCRKLSHMKRLVYVSCDPQAATKNLVDLCRMTSKKYEGEPFRVVRIQPVDLFPQTKHYEWVVVLERE